jgi:hypothetical protein
MRASITAAQVRDPNHERKDMNQQAFDEALSIKDRVIAGMVSYMKFGGAENEQDPDFDPEWDAGYTQADVDDCEKLLQEYLDSIQQSDGDGADIMKAVEVVVCALNDLNNRCNGGLIETGQREDIAEFIDAVIEAKGIDIDALADSHNRGERDLTENWREW